MNATPNVARSQSHWVPGTSDMASVAMDPASTQPKSNCLRRPRRSAVAPSIGASSAAATMAAELAYAQRAVARYGGIERAATDAKKGGSTAAVIVVAKAELAQS